MRVGTLCYATEQGLGYLAKAFFDNGVVNKPFVVRHSSRQTHMNWYPEGTPAISPGDMRFRSTVSAYLNSIDVLMVFETPFWWGVFDEARMKRVKTVLMPMYECMPRELPKQPDLILNPSALDHRYFPSGRLVTVPVYSNTWRPMGKRIETFVHNAGHHGLFGRNGTAELIEAWPMVNPEARLVLRTQEKLTPEQYASLRRCGNVEVVGSTVPYDQLYSVGEAFVFPEKFNGLSLPLQEAFAAGMTVITTNRFPNTEWLPKEPLIKVKSAKPRQVNRSFLSFEEAVIDPHDIANKINEMYGKDPTVYAELGQKWGRDNDWSVWAPKYREILTNLLEG